MKILASVSGGISSALVISALLLTPLVASAQDDGPNYVRARVLNIKPDSIAQFEAAMADRAQVTEAGGWPFFHVYERVRGDLPGYTIFTLDPELGDLPPLPADPDWLNRVRDAEDRTQLMTLQVYPELGIDSGTFEPAGQYMRVRIRTVAPGNREAFMAAQAEDVVPALRAAGVTDRRFARVMFGGNTNTFVNFRYSDEFPGTEAGNPVAEAMGQREYDRMLARLQSLITVAEDLVYMYRPDLSFTAE